MSNVPNPQITARLQRLSRLGAVLVIGVGSLVIVGWLFNIEIMKSVLPGLATMKFNTALGFILAGGGLLSLPRHDYTRDALAIILLLLGLLTLSEYIFNWNLGIDQFFVQDIATNQNLYPGRMSPVTALNFCLIGSSLLLIVRPSTWVIGQILALVATFAAMVSLAGYIYDVRSLYQISIFSSMALPTTLAFITIGLAILFSYPQHGLTSLMVAEGAGGVLTRRLLPAVIVIPVLFGWLWLKGQEAGLYDANFGLALDAVSNVSLFIALVFWNARTLNRMDIERNRAMIALREMNEQLEEKVQKRTADLMNANQILEQEIIERKRSQMLYQTLVEHLPDTAVIMFDHEMRYTIADGPILKTTGFTQDKMLGKTIFEVLPLESQQALLPMYERVLQGESLQFERQTADLYYDSRFVPVYGVDGSITNGLIVVQDITHRKQAEESLAQLAAIVQSSADAIIAKTLEGTVTSWNFGAERIFGYKASEMIGQSILKLFPPQRENEEPQILATLMQGELVDQFESVRVTKDGRHIPVSLTISLLKDANGHVIGVCKIARDITERKRVEDALRANEEKFQTIFELLPVGASLIDNSRQIVQMNRALERILDMTMDNLLLGKYQSRKYIHPNGTPMLASEFPSERAVIEQQAVFDVEIGIIKEDDTTLWTRVSAAPLPRNQGVVVVTVDFTERKQAEARLQESERHFRLLAQNSPDVIYIMDLIQQRATYLNRAEFFGYSQEEIERSGSVLHGLHPDDKDKVLAHWQEAIVEGKLSNMSVIEYRLKDKAGEWQWVLSRESIFATTPEGKPTQVLVTLTVITNRKKAEQQAIELAKERERIKILSNFIQDASHDFRTPLSIISISLYLLSKSTDPERQQAQVHKAERQIARLIKLLDRLLLMARLDSEIVFVFQPVNLNQLAADLYNSIGVEAKEKNITLTSFLSEDTLSVQADPKELLLALTELGQNGVTYTPANGTITIQTKRQDGQAVFEIRDTGSGIPASELPYIFQRLYRVDKARSLETGGSGLGLSIAKRITELHQGNIVVESVVGEGSLFRLLLPLSSTLPMDS